jgi:hypothetical protein
MHVRQFGRTARFDYLQTAGELGLAPITPDALHCQGSTGPVAGARLLFGDPGNSPSLADLENSAVKLDGYLNLGLDAIEDALCNWQKSPALFRPFRG